MGKVYLGVNDSWLASNINENIVGNDAATSTEVVTIASGVTGVTLSQSVERVDLGGLYTNYSYQKAGNVVHVYQTVGGVKSEVANAIVQDNADGTRLTFLDGTINVTYDGTTMKLGDATITTISDTTPTVAASAIDTTLKSPGAAAGTTYTLTTGADVKTATTFYGDLTGSASNPVTLQMFDTLNGTAGSANNKLVIVDGDSTHKGASGDMFPVGITISNIQNVTLTTSGNAGINQATPFNVSGVTGLTSVNVTTGGTGIDSVQAATTADITVVRNNSGAKVFTEGGKNVTVTDANVASAGVQVGGALTTNPAGAVVVNENGTGTATVAVDGGTSVTVTTTSTGGVTIGAVTAPAGAVTVTDNGGNATSITGGASATVTAKATAIGAVQVAGVTGATTANLTGVTTGASYVTGGTGATFNTTGGNNVTLGGTAAGTTSSTLVVAGNASVTDTNSSSYGANADVLTVYATGTANVTTTATNSTITVGNTADKLQSPTGAVTVVDKTVAGSTTYYGVEAVNIFTNGATSASVTGAGGGAGAVHITDQGATNKLATVTLTGVTGLATIAADTALATVAINDSLAKNAFGATATATTVSYQGVAANALAVNLNGASNTGTGVTDAANLTKTINVTATGTVANNITLTDTALTALSLTNNGTAALTLKGLSNAAAAVTVAGSGAVALGNLDANTALLSINGSTATGAITAEILAGGSTTFTGGSGANVLQIDTVSAVPVARTGTAAAPVVVAQPFNGGSGTNNTIIFTDAISNYTFGGNTAPANFQNMQLQSNFTTAATPALITMANGAYVGTGNTSVVIGGLVGTNTSITSMSAPIALNLKASPGNFTNATVGAGFVTGDFPTYALNGAAPVIFATGSNDAIGIATALNTALNGSGVYFTANAGNTVVTSHGNFTSLVLADGVHAFTGQTAAASNAITYSLTAAAATVATANNLPITIGTTTAAIGTSAALPVTLNEASNQTITVTAQADKVTSMNYLSVLDQTLAADANPATSIVVKGAGGLALAYGIGGGGATNALATVDASQSTGNIDTTNVTGAAAGLTVKAGTGSLTVKGSAAGTDTITGGIGGTIFTENGLSTIENITLASAATVNDTINLAQAATATVGNKSINVTGFSITASPTSSDVINVGTAAAVTAGASPVTIANQTTAGVAVPVTTPGTGADTYTVSNGIITFTGPDTGATLLADAESIVNTNVGLVAQIGAYTAGGNTYVITSTTTKTVATDTVVTLNGVTGVLGFGTTAAANSIVISGGALTDFTGTADAVVKATPTATFDETGFGVVSLLATATGTQTITNLAPSAIVNSADITANGVVNITTSHLAAATAGSNSLTFNITDADTHYGTLTFNGDNAWTIGTKAAAAGNSVIATLVDANNTAATLNISGASTLGIGTITDSALKTINITDSAAVTLGSTNTPLSQAGLTVALKAGAGTAAHNITLSGANDIVTVADATTATITDTGSGLTYTDSSTTSHVNTVVASGSGNNITIQKANTSINLITVGDHSSVTLNTANGDVSVITITGDVAGGTSAAVVAGSNWTTITGAHDAAASAGTKVIASLGGAANAADATAVNVASAGTSLAAALDIAAAHTSAIGTAAGDAYVDWFQFSGNTYVVEHIGAAETALSTNDYVIKLTGLVDLSGHLAIANTTGVIGL